VLQPAIDDLEQLVQRQPRVLKAYALSGSAYSAKWEWVRATEAFRKLATLAPWDPRGPYLVGIGLRAQAKPAEAKKELEAPLALAPGYAEPVAELISMAFTEKRPDLALSRVTEQITAEPKSGALRYLLGLERGQAHAGRSLLAELIGPPDIVSSAASSTTIVKETTQSRWRIVFGVRIREEKAPFQGVNGGMAIATRFPEVTYNENYYPRYLACRIDDPCRAGGY
jgi:tetratricopeptide (TPR) repeat protein